ncbi:hypothetical protein D3C76_1280300 [compost metagenome]
MGHKAGGEVTADARHAAHAVADAVSIQAGRGGFAALVHQLRAAVEPLFMGVLGTQTGIRGPAVGDVVFAAPHTEFVLDIAVGPFLRVVAIVLRWLGHEVHASHVDPGFRAVEGFLLIAHVYGAAELIPRIVQAGGEQRGATAVVGDRRFAFTVHYVNPGAKLVAVAKATPGIQGSANLRI